MFPYNSSLQFLSISFFSIFLLLPCSTVSGKEYKTCTTALFSCGKDITAVGYPFWGDDRPVSCGYPSLQLRCLFTEDGGQAQLVIGQGMYYNVSNMKFNQLSISLELQVFQNIPCSFNSTEFSELFKFTSSDDKITLVYDCPKGISLNNLHAAVPCSASAAVNQAYYLNNMSAGNEYASCRSFEFPVAHLSFRNFNATGVDCPQHWL